MGMILAAWRRKKYAPRGADIEDPNWRSRYEDADRRIDMAWADEPTTLNEMFPDINATQLVVLHYRCVVGLTQVETARMMGKTARTIQRIEAGLKGMDSIPGDIWPHSTT